jgi:LysM repeat protein
MGRVLIKLIFLVTSILLVGKSFAQDSPSKREVVGDNGKYIVHTVETKQTLYAISKMYSVTVEDLQKANLGIEAGGIKIGQSLRIPIKEINKKEAKKASITLSADTMYHEVLKKETVYALTKKYAISESQLNEYNPTLKEGLKVGMVIKVPLEMNQTASDTIMEFDMPVQDSLQLHEIMPKETLYSLSKLYAVSIDSIQMVNNGLMNGLKVGSSIRIPLPNEHFNNEVYKDSLLKRIDDTRPFNKKDTLKIAVFLPFCNDKNLALQVENENEELYVLTKVSLDFMRGIELATDSLNYLGYHVTTQYFDTKKDTNECNRIVKEDSLKGYHLFIGPLYQVNFKILALRAQELQIPIVSPVRVSSRLLLDNKYVIKSRASSPAQVVYEAQYVGDKFGDSNLVLFSGGASQDKRYATIFQKYVNNATNDSVPIHRVWQPNIDNFKRHLKLGETNYVAVLSTDEAFVSSALSVFYRLGVSDSETKFVVFGLDSWKTFGSIDFEYLMNLNVTYPVQQFISYYSPEALNFIANYREVYFTDPSSHVYSGFDIGWYFGHAIFKSNGDWENYISTTKGSGLSLRFDFIKIGEESGFENQGGYLLKNADNDLHLIH